MMSKGGGSRHMYGTKTSNINTDTITSNANSFVDKYAEKSMNEGESESLLEKDIQVSIFLSMKMTTERLNLNLTSLTALVRTGGKC